MRSESWKPSRVVAYITWLKLASHSTHFALNEVKQPLAMFATGWSLLQVVDDLKFWLLLVQRKRNPGNKYFSGQSVQCRRKEWRYMVWSITWSALPLFQAAFRVISPVEVIFGIIYFCTEPTRKNALKHRNINKNAFQNLIFCLPPKCWAVPEVKTIESTRNAENIIFGNDFLPYYVTKQTSVHIIIYPQVYRAYTKSVVNYVLLYFIY